MNDVARPLLRTKKTAGGKFRGRRAEDSSLEPDGYFRSMPRDKRRARQPMPFYYLNIIRAVETKRGGETISERAHWYLNHSAFPHKSDRTLAAFNAVRRWLLDPTRSTPPTAESLAQAKRRKTRE